MSVLIPVLDEERHLRGAVERMLAQDLEGEVEFLFIDGGSADASLEILAAFAAADPRVHVLHNPARRTPQALNLGLHAARGELIARMDAHTRYPPDYLRLGAERLRRGDVAHVSGPALAVGAGGWSDRIALALRTPLGVGGADFRRTGEEEFEVDTGFAGLWTRSLLLEHGGWDEGWPTDQDCELAFRLSADGEMHHVCLPRMAAEYLPRDSLGRLWRQYWQFGLHKTKTFNRHPRAMRPSHLLPPAAALTVAAAVVSPRPLRGAARYATALYAAALVAGAAKAAVDGAPPRDAAALPLVYATMQLSYGFGLLAGARRYGFPAAAVAGAVRRAL